MSAKIKPSFTVNGKRYEFYYSKAMQVEYQRMVDEKKKDKEYQQSVAEYTRLQQKYERIHEAYIKAENEFFQDPANEKLQETYDRLERLEKRAFDEFNEYAATHADGDGREFVMYCLGKLVLYALQEQHGLDENKATEVWNEYVAEAGEVGSMLFLSCVGAAFFTDTSENIENPFIQAQMAKIEAENNRHIGLNKIKK